MARIAKRNCPYCRTQAVAFTAQVEWQVISGGKRALFLCGSCNEGVIWEYAFPHSLVQGAGDVDKSSAIFGEQWPKYDQGEAPDDTPSTVRNYFEQGTSSLSVGNFDAAGIMFRKTLESATKILDPQLASLGLVKRIDKLASAGRITSDLATWAHEVRLGGNDAAHEDDPFTLEDAEHLRNFIENFLRYAFTLPSAVKRRARPGGGEPATE